MAAISKMAEKKMVVFILASKQRENPQQIDNNLRAKIALGDHKGSIKCV